MNKFVSKIAAYAFIAFLVAGAAYAATLGAPFSTSTLMSQQTADAVAITGGTISGVTLSGLTIAAASLVATGSVATALTGNVGPTGSHTTVQKWFKVQDSSGNNYWLPAF